MLLGLGVVKRYYFAENRYQFNSQMFLIGPEWMEITAEHVVACDGYYQQFVLTIQTPYQITDDWKIKLKDGKLADIECVLIGTDGQEYPCQSSSYLGTKEPTFKERDVDETKARKRNYRAVKLRCSQSLLCSGARIDCRNPPIWE